MKEYLKPEAELVVLFAQEAIAGEIPYAEGDDDDAILGTTSNPFD